MNGNRKRVGMPEGNVVRGLFRLAHGDAGGIREFGNTTRAFYASLAPLLAFPLVGAALFGLDGHWNLAIVMLLSRISGALIQPVATEFVAQRAKSSATWLMTSTALNWSIWLIFPLMLIGALVANGLTALGLPQTLAIVLAAGFIALYLLWFQWFVLRTGLRLNAWWALAALIAMNVTIAAVYLIPYIFHPDLMELTLHPPAT
ncbi:MAG: hypothetical protein PHT60_03915 [Acidiphilium sp.]|nr:hypothetical protein [Acidiphilium sp.]MDD4934904.1 hypothetical protein [Acidiphilium sp.]